MIRQHGKEILTVINNEHGRFLAKSERQEDQFKETTNDQYHIQHNTAVRLRDWVLTASSSHTIS